MSLSTHIPTKYDSAKGYNSTPTPTPTHKQEPQERQHKIFQKHEIALGIIAGCEHCSIEYRRKISESLRANKTVLSNNKGMYIVSKETNI